MYNYQPYVSVILPTYQREAVLCNTIKQLLNQTYPNYEIIIVDQSYQHNTETAICLEEFSSQTRYFKVENPSLPGARNFGVKHAKGEIVLFIDDDVIVPPEWVEIHVRNYRDGQVGGVAGRVLDDRIPIVNTLKVGYVTSWGKMVRNFASSHRTFVSGVPGGNASFRRELIGKAGGFDEAFSGNALFEETDFSYRLLQLGYKIVFDPDTTIYHLAEVRGGCEKREKDDVDFYYWFIHNKVLFVLKNMPIYTLFFVLISNFIKAMIVGLWKTHNIKSFVKLLCANIDGMTTFFKTRKKEVI